MVLIHIEYNRYCGIEAENELQYSSDSRTIVSPFPMRYRISAAAGSPYHHRGSFSAAMRIWVTMEVVVVFPWFPLHICVFISLHNIAPSLARSKPALPLSGCGYFRIVVMGSGSPDYKIGSFNIFGSLSNNNIYSKVSKAFYCLCVF